jgi:hypothetical protein
MQREPIAGGPIVRGFVGRGYRLGDDSVATALLMTVERADGAHVFGSATVSDALQEAGFGMTPQGLRIRP